MGKCIFAVGRKDFNPVAPLAGGLALYIAGESGGIYTGAFLHPGCYTLVSCSLLMCSLVRVLKVVLPGCVKDLTTG